MEAEDIIDAQLDSYRNRDLESFLSFYSPDIVIKSGDGKIIMGSLDAMRENYPKRCVQY
jgi:hypothetical protein